MKQLLQPVFGDSGGIVCLKLTVTLVFFLNTIELVLVVRFEMAWENVLKVALVFFLLGPFDVSAGDVQDDIGSNLIIKIKEIYSRDWTVHWSLVLCDANCVVDAWAKRGALSDDFYVKWLTYWSSSVEIVLREVAAHITG
ncbi:hypothetical protein PIB30_067821 [Stylosanthes scabra]|uniref:Uncharacterized protein n=1 Tax=Stylosanthes scabra TaxID=79078 RepID=A0ABU6SNQ7_9FABA|nr:hypothetical protein [Stylosanthes scabra]